jgi:hypothetical protein
MGADPNYDSCALVDAGAARLGIAQNMWLVETNTGVASACLGPNQCATTFASPAMLAASFNRTAWLAKGQVISTEMRALHNIGEGMGLGIGMWWDKGVWGVVEMSCPSTSSDDRGMLTGCGWSVLLEWVLCRSRGCRWGALRQRFRQRAIQGWAARVRAQHQPHAGPPLGPQQ